MLKKLSTPPAATSGTWPARPAPTSAVTPAAKTSPPSASRTRPARRDGRTAASVSAATGGTRVPCQAGSAPAPAVSSVPRPRQSSTVRRLTTNPPESGTSSADSNAFMPWASPTPASTPSTEATSPITAASSRVARNTWPRLAPTSRSSAVRRVRWASTMAKVLAMTKPATTTATAAKVIRNSPN